MKKWFEEYTEGDITLKVLTVILLGLFTGIAIGWIFVFVLLIGQLF